MSDPLFNKIITITSIEDKEKQIKLKDHEGKTFSFWKTKKDGEMTKAYQTFKSLNIAINSTVSASYKVDEWENQGKPVKSNIVLIFKDSEGQQSQEVEPFVSPKELDARGQDTQMIITRTALAKSAIESGQMFGQFIKEESKWLNYVLTGVKPNQTDEVNVDEIPF